MASTKELYVRKRLQAQIPLCAGHPSVHHAFQVNRIGTERHYVAFFKAHKGAASRAKATCSLDRLSERLQLARQQSLPCGWR